MLKKCKFILENLRAEDLEELKIIWNENWKEKVLKSFEQTEVKFAYGLDEFGDEIPIAMGGFYEFADKSSKVACVWLLTTKFVHKNKFALMKVLKNEIERAQKKYDIMYNFIYEANYEAKGWLKKLGFCFDNPKPKNLNVRENFEFFYKLNNRKEK